MPYEGRIGRRYRVLITEESPDEKHYVGHNKFYEQILVARDHCRLGQWVEVEVTSYGKHFMVGQPVAASWLPSVDRVKKSFLAHRDLIGQVWLSSCVAILFSSLLYRIYRRVGA